MEGILLAGGSGTRLYPLTKIINKHLLPVYNKPMIYYPIELLVKANIRDIIIIVNKEYQIKQFEDVLDKDNEFGLNSIKYIIQGEPKGTAHAISLCRNILNKKDFVVAWGDNIYEYGLMQLIRKYDVGVKIFIKRTNNLKHYGEVVINKERKVIKINYREDNLKSKGYALTGTFIFNELIFSYIDNIGLNYKGELDIVDAINLYLLNNEAQYEKVRGYWIDAGSSFDNLFIASRLVKNQSANKSAYP